MPDVVLIAILYRTAPSTANLTNRSPVERPSIKWSILMDRIFFCRACGNVFAPSPAEKERIQRGLANGTPYVSHS